MVGTQGRGLGRVVLLAAAVILATGAGEGGQASRGKEGSQPTPRGPKLPRRLPAVRGASGPSADPAARPSAGLLVISASGTLPVPVPVPAWASGAAVAGPGLRGPIASSDPVAAASSEWVAIAPPASSSAPVAASAPLPVAAELGPLLAASEQAVQAGPGVYADSLEALGARALAFERSAEDSYVYCLRVTATYEHAWFDADGTLRRGFARRVQHGTGFVFRAEGGEYFVATNHHVVSLPEATGPEVVLEGVPAGSRKVREEVHIVRGEEDDYAAGFIPLTPVAAEPALDAAVLKTSRPLKVMPWRLGSSAALRMGNLVLTRGFPLGALPAANLGRVTNPRHRDTESGWDHLDFITDAALNNGNSGSPVLAISARTGEPELVGIFHARYRDATGMGVVVGVDGLRGLLETLRVPPAPAAAGEDRGAVSRLLALSGGTAFFPFAGRIARAVAHESGVRFEVFDDFPVTESAQVVLLSPAREAGPAPEAAGGAGRGAAGEQVPREPVERLEPVLWRALGATLRLRRALEADDGSQAAHQAITRLRRELPGFRARESEALATFGYQREALAAGLGPGQGQVSGAEPASGSGGR